MDKNTLYDLIETWHLNKSFLALKMGMPAGTFKNKLTPNQSYFFTDIEERKLRKILKQMAQDIEKLK